MSYADYTPTPDFGSADANPDYVPTPHFNTSMDLAASLAAQATLLATLSGGPDGRWRGIYLYRDPFAPVTAQTHTATGIYTYFLPNSYTAVGIYLYLSTALRGLQASRLFLQAASSETAVLHCSRLFLQVCSPNTSRRRAHTFLILG